jgi:hypothetical protein
MAAGHDVFAAREEHLVRGTGDVQVWQLIYFYLDKRTILWYGIC